MRTHRLRAVALAVLSALTAEFLLGDQYLGGLAPAGRQLAMIIIFTVFYGGAAVLIREVARRRSQGWPTILFLAAAFGVVEEGVVTQSLFNPDYLHAHLLAHGFLPWLGTAPPWLFFVLALHVIWSMAVPIALAEQLFGGGGPAEPWLGRVGLIVAAAGVVVGGASIGVFTYASGPFLAPWPQLAGSLVVAAVLVVVALQLRRPPRTGRYPLLSFVVTAGLSSAFHLARYSSPGPWLTTAAMAVIAVAAIVIISRARLDVFGAACGALFTYGWVGLANAGPVGPAAVAEQLVIVVAYAVLVAIALRTHARRPVRVPSEYAGR